MWQLLKMDLMMEAVQKEAKKFVVNHWNRNSILPDWILTGQKENNVMFSWRPLPPPNYRISRNGDIIMEPFTIRLPPIMPLRQPVPVEKRKRIEKRIQREQRR